MDRKSKEYQTSMDRYERGRAAADAERDSHNPILYGGTGLGLVGLIVGLAWQLHPTTPEQARELADKYNKKLKQDLESGTPVQPTKTSVQMNVSGALLPGGGAMVLHGSF
jgi:tRNA A37 N6-isopentenylltransferase MiaA